MVVKLLSDPLRCSVKQFKSVARCRCVFKCSDNVGVVQVEESKNCCG